MLKYDFSVYTAKMLYLTSTVVAMRLVDRFHEGNNQQTNAHAGWEQVYVLYVYECDRACVDVFRNTTRVHTDVVLTESYVTHSGRLR